MNFVIDSVVIRLLDEMVEDKTLFCHRIVLRNIRLYTRLILLILPEYYNNSVQILHALGLLHEHQRPDRDQYIDVDMTTATYYGRSQQLRKACFLER